LKFFDPFLKAVVSGGYSTDPFVPNFRQYGFFVLLVISYTTGEMSENTKKGLFEKKGKDLTIFNWIHQIRADQTAKFIFPNEFFN
jgi:hypothetical protein